MLGRIIYVRGPGRTGLELERIGELPLLRGTLFEPEGLRPWRLRRSLRQLGRLLERQGVRRLILPEGFPYAGAFSGFGRVELLPFYRAEADLLALGALGLDGVEPQRAWIALSASHLCPELTAAARRLCPQVRRLIIDVPGEGARYAAWLHRQYGLPVAPGTGADVTVAFAPGGGRWGRVLELGGEEPELGGLELAAPELALPEEYAARLMAALWERGALERGQLQVRYCPRQVCP